MDWNKISSSISNITLPSINTTTLQKNFSSSLQSTREAFGAVPQEEITLLPAEYLDLEARVDALRLTHLNVLKIARVYENETYDYPTGKGMEESLSEWSQKVGHGVTSFAATNLKGTAIPAPTPTAAPTVVHKTLPHALSRTTAASASLLGTQDRLGQALTLYSNGYSQIATSRLTLLSSVQTQFLKPWNITLTNSISHAMKARAAVKASRLELDARKSALKSAGPQRAEQARLEVENAEDDLVQKTEVAIGLMKAVLENPEPLKNLNALAKAQLTYHAAAAEALQAMQGDVEELATAAEGEYRKSRDH